MVEMMVEMMDLLDVMMVDKMAEMMVVLMDLKPVEMTVVMMA